MYCEKGKGSHNREQDSAIIEAKVKCEGQFELAFKLDYSNNWT